MADKNTYISLHGVGQWLPIAPCGAVIVLDRGVEYGTSYELNCLTGDIRYTPGSIDGFRFIIASTNVYGGGDAPVTRQDYAVWGPNEKFPVATLRGDMGQGLRNSSLLTRNPFGFLSQYKEYTNGTFISCWKSLYDFNRSWTVWDDWFIPSREELMNLVNQTTPSGGSNLFGFIKRGWIEASSEYTADYGKADSALLTDGSEGSGAQKSSQSYGRLYFKYIGGTGYEGFNGSTALPTGVTGSIPLGYESVSFKRLLSQSGADTLAWGNSANLNTYLTQEAVTYLSGMANGMTIGEGCKISMLLSLGSGISLGSGVLESTAYIGDNLFLFSNRISTQANTFGSLPLSRIGFREKDADGAELLPFIPSRDELITILNNSRGKGLFTEGEEFWSVSDASATQAYSVTYHEASEPTVNTRDKTTGLKCLVCRWNPSLSDLPKVEDPVLSIVDVPLFDITVVQPEGGTLTVNPTQQLEAGTPVFVYISTSIANNKFGTLSVTTAGGSAVGFTTIAEGQYTFTMPSDNVTVSCTFTQVEKPVTYFAYQRAPDNAYVVVYNEFLPIWFVSIDPDSDVIWDILLIWFSQLILIWVIWMHLTWIPVCFVKS